MLKKIKDVIFVNIIDFIFENRFISTLLLSSLIYLIGYEYGFFEAKNTNSNLIPIGSILIKMAYAILTGIILFLFIDYIPKKKESKISIQVYFKKKWYFETTNYRTI